MSRITTPASITTSPAAAQPLLEAVQQQLGSVPNLFRVIGNSPATLEGYLGFSGALGKGALSLKTRNRIAVLVAELNQCDYCLSAHTYLGKHAAKLDDAELSANRDASSDDAQAMAALRFARKLVTERGRVTAADVDAVRSAGYSDAQLVEIVAHVALNTFTNYLNVAVDTAVDFPLVTHRS
jgi:uncharacterized peroxidase-related enzyme